MIPSDVYTVKGVGAGEGGSPWPGDHYEGMEDEFHTRRVSVRDEIEDLECKYNTETNVELKRDHPQLVEVKDDLDIGVPDRKTKNSE